MLAKILSGNVKPLDCLVLDGRENAFDLNVDEKDRYFVNSFFKPRIFYSNSAG